VVTGHVNKEPRQRDRFKNPCGNPRFLTLDNSFGMQVSVLAQNREGRRGGGCTRGVKSGFH
jgi:hypothetical protein